MNTSHPWGTFPTCPETHPPRGTLKTCPTRGGMTLVELLVVITIIVIVFAALVPRIRPAIEDLKLREGSRQVNAYIASAQAVAGQQKRPYGVRLRPIAGVGVLELVSLETPPPYAGDD